MKIRIELTVEEIGAIALNYYKENYGPPPAGDKWNFQQEGDGVFIIENAPVTSSAEDRGQAFPALTPNDLPPLRPGEEYEQPGVPPPDLSADDPPF